MTPKNIGYSFTRPSYAPPGTYPPPMSSSEIKEFDESYLSQTIEVSERALEHYNKKHHTNYELVEALRSNGILHGGIWFHCNFKAKDKSVSELPIKLFFAELKVVKALPSKFEVTACRILDAAIGGEPLFTPLMASKRGFIIGICTVFLLCAHAQPKDQEITKSCKAAFWTVWEAQYKQYNYILVVGTEEIENGKVSVRVIDEKNFSVFSIEELLKLFKEKVGSFE